jgi:hypothetical protein
MSYATYDYYTESFGGTQIPYVEFPRAAGFASAYIDALTLGRAADAVSAGLLDAVCAVAETYWAEQARGGVESESADGDSVHYETASAGEKLYAAAEIYLLNTGLLYRGMNR